MLAFVTYLQESTVSQTAEHQKLLLVAASTAAAKLLVCDSHHDDAQMQRVARGHAHKKNAKDIGSKCDQQIPKKN